VGLFLVILALVAVLAAGVLYLRHALSRETRAAGDAGAPPGVVARRYWGKQFVLQDGAPACDLARKCAGIRFPNGQIPDLPLKGCKQSHCQCHFVALPEHRSGKERRSGFDRRTGLRFEPGKTDRRSGVDRRSHNNNPYDSL